MEGNIINPKDGIKIYKNDYINQGASGIVYGCKWNDIPCAAKIVNLKGQSDTILKSIESEKELLITLKGTQNPNIVLVYDVIIKDEKVYIIMERCDGDLSGEMRKREQKNQPYTTQEVIKIMQEFLNGYKYCHERKIIHRDLKPANLLVHKGIIKIADLGYAKVMSEINQAGMHSMVGTPAYVAPQILRWEPYSSLADMYSFGVILFSLVYQCLPIKATTQKGLADEQTSYSMNPLVIPDKIGVPDELRELIERMLRFYESDRISWQDLFDHPLINSVKSQQQPQQQTEKNIQGPHQKVPGQINQSLITIKRRQEQQNKEVPPQQFTDQNIQGKPKITKKQPIQLNQKHDSVPQQQVQPQISQQPMDKIDQEINLIQNKYGPPQKAQKYSQEPILNVSPIQKLICILEAKKDLAIRLINSLQTILQEKKAFLDQLQSFFFKNIMIGYIYCILKNIDGIYKNSSQQMSQKILELFKNASNKSAQGQFPLYSDNQKYLDQQRAIQQLVQQYYAYFLKFQSELQQLPNSLKQDPQFKESLIMLNQKDPTNSDEYYEQFQKIYKMTIRPNMIQLTFKQIIDVTQLKFIYDCEKFLFLEEDSPTKDFLQINNDTILLQPDLGKDLKAYIKIQEKRA